MEIHQVRYFIALSRALNFTRAAEICCVTQPALTKGIKRLEAELGGELITRERQSTHLTDLGRRVLPKLREMIAAADAAEELAAAFLKTRPMVLRIGLTPCVSAGLVRSLLPPLALALPDIEFEFVEQGSEALLSRVEQGAVSAALIGDLQAIPVRMAAWPLFQERLVVVSGKGAMAGTGDMNPQALQEAVWLERPDCKHTARFWQHMFSGGQPAKIAHRGQSMSHLIELTASGLGLMLVPEHLSRVMPVTVYSTDRDPLTRVVHLVARGDKPYGAALEAFIRSLRNVDWAEHLRGLEPGGKRSGGPS